MLNERKKSLTFFAREKREKKVFALCSVPSQQAPNRSQQIRQQFFAAASSL
jgi:hypothetical protein